MGYTQVWVDVSHVHLQLKGVRGRCDGLAKNLKKICVWPPIEALNVISGERGGHMTQLFAKKKAIRFFAHIRCLSIFLDLHGHTSKRVPAKKKILVWVGRWRMRGERRAWNARWAQRAEQLWLLGHLGEAETGFPDQYLTFWRAFEKVKRLTHSYCVTESEWLYNLSKNSRLSKEGF